MAEEIKYFKATERDQRCAGLFEFEMISVKYMFVCLALSYLISVRRFVF